MPEPVPGGIVMSEFAEGLAGELLDEVSLDVDGDAVGSSQCRIIAIDIAWAAE